MTDDLRRLAEAATPGPWTTERFDESEHAVWPVDTSKALVASVRTEPDAAYIAALSPSTVLPLLDVVEAARELADELDRIADKFPSQTLAWVKASRLRAALERLDR